MATLSSCLVYLYFLGAIIIGVCQRAPACLPNTVPTERLPSDLEKFVLFFLFVFSECLE
ncbi:rCG24545 [Rattus norvegicus]|uniref:RCG24545 n=1 Tax=Rattus norvegicus TaxID=10116 RepID=A6JBV3_RAT|nr:rCG24545 [Rattus norvegicus]